MSNTLTRRTFLEAAALGLIGSSVDAKTGMPLRTLGKTGEKVSALAFGCGSRWLMYKEEVKALEAMTRAVDLGINYLDCAYGYGDGVSEERVGKFLKARGGKKGLFVVTKLNVRTYDDAMSLFEGSLKRMNTDHVDLCHIHSLANEDDLAAIEAKNGILKAMYKLRDEKMARFIGISCHTNPSVLKTALERHDFNVTQMALNLAKMGNNAPSNVPGTGQTGQKGFESIALPVALKKNMGVIAMKIFAQEKLLGKAPVETLIRYSMSLPVSAVVIGMPKLEYIDHNVGVAKNFKPMNREEMDRMSESVATQWKASIDHYFSDHVDA
jgi:predicted aldo/keto reductase-like oxidoreductase